MHIYVHIPFCRKKCHYCHFALTTEYDDIKIRRYIAYVQQEICDFFVQHACTNVRTIYFGGGTPSAIDPTYIQDILTTIRSHTDIHDANITLEANPEDITTPYLQALRSMGIDRLSIGIQTLDPDVLAITNRRSDIDLHAVIDIAADIFTNISIDLIL